MMASCVAPFAVLEKIDQIKILVCLPKMNDLTFLGK